MDDNIILLGKIDLLLFLLLCGMLLAVIVVGLLCSFIDTAITLMRSWFDKGRQGRKWQKLEQFTAKKLDMVRLRCFMSEIRNGV